MCNKFEFFITVPAPARMWALMVECGPVYIDGMEPTHIAPPRHGTKGSRSQLPSTFSDFGRPPIDFIGQSSRMPQPGGSNWNTGGSSRVPSDMATFKRPPQSNWPDGSSQARREPKPWVPQRNRNQTTTEPKIPQKFFNQLDQLPIDASIRHSLLNAIMDSPLPELDTDNFLPGMLNPQLGSAMLPDLPRQRSRPAGALNPRNRDIAIHPSGPRGPFGNEDPRSKIAKPSSKEKRPSGVPDPRNGNIPTRPSMTNPRSTKIAPLPTNPPSPDVASTNNTTTNIGPMSKAIVDKGVLPPTVGNPHGLSKNQMVKSEGPIKHDDTTTGKQAKLSIVVSLCRLFMIRKLSNFTILFINRY